MPIKRKYILTQPGQDKLRKAIDHKYGKTRYKTRLAQYAGIDRNVLTKIEQGIQGGDFHPINNLFSALDLDLEETDYQEVQPSSANSPEQRRQNSKIQEQLKTALWDLDYTDQEAKFKSSLKNMKGAGTFIIQGQPGCGQRWFINRIIRQSGKRIARRFFTTVFVLLFTFSR